MSERPSGTVTLLFTDIQGSTRLLRQLGELYASVLADHRDLLRAAFRAHSGHEVDTQGDAFFVTFHRASDALAAAVEGQRALAGHPWPGGAEVKVRMGLHTGTPVAVDEGYVGIDVHRAARICAAGHGGQIVLSSTIGRLLDGTAAEVRLADLGEHRLKDIDRPEHLYQVVVDDLPGRFPPPRSLTTPIRLPSFGASFVGRDDEVEMVRSTLRGEARLLTLTGPGGTGKTRLSVQAASGLAKDFVSGIHFVSLAPERNAEEAVAAIASALDVGVSGDRSLWESLTEHLGGGRFLLLLDNFEHLVEAAPMVTNLLDDAPDLKVLATSRVPLHLSSERELRLAPLPAPSQHEEPRAAMRSDAAALFVDRALAADPHLDVQREAPAIVEICRRLDGLPLAIELAASRCRVMAPSAILERLDRSLKLLTGGPRDAPDRQRTMRAAIDWSYELLGEEERVCFRSMSPFVGGATLQAIEEVVPDGVDALEGLDSLVSQSLTMRVRDADGHERFRMLEIIRSYASEILEASADSSEVRARHALYFARLADELHERLHTSDAGSAAETFTREFDNMRLALQWLVDEPNPPANRAWALRLAAGIGGHLYRVGLPRDGIVLLERALEGSEGVDEKVRARALQALGALYDIASEVERARSVLEEALAISRRAGDPARIGSALNSLGAVAQTEGDIGSARVLTEEALAIRRRLGDRAGIATSMSNLGLIVFREGRVDEAHALLLQSLEIDRDLGLEWPIAVDHVNLSAVTLSRGDRDQAVYHARHALEGLKRMGDDDGLIEGIEAFANIATADRAYERAARLLGAAAQLRDSGGLPPDAPDIPLIKGWIESIKAGLGEDGFQRAYQEGQHMTRDQAVGYAQAL